MKFKVLCGILLAALLMAVYGLFEAYSGRITAEGEKAIYASRAAGWEAEYIAASDALDEAEAAVIKAEAAQLSLLEGLDAVPQGELLITCYDTDCKVCQTGHVTYSGMRAMAGVTVAADLQVYPIGTVLYIEGVGLRVVTDTGGGVQRDQLDLLVDDAHGAEAKEIYGRRRVWVVSGEY